MIKKIQIIKRQIIIIDQAGCKICHKKLTSKDLFLNRLRICQGCNSKIAYKDMIKGYKGARHG